MTRQGTLRDEACDIWSAAPICTLLYSRRAPEDQSLTALQLFSVALYEHYLKVQPRLSSTHLPTLPCHYRVTSSGTGIVTKLTMRLGDYYSSAMTGVSAQAFDAYSRVHPALSLSRSASGSSYSKVPTLERLRIQYLVRSRLCCQRQSDLALTTSGEDAEPSDRAKASFRS